MSRLSDYTSTLLSNEKGKICIKASTSESTRSVRDCHLTKAYKGLLRGANSIL